MNNELIRSDSGYSPRNLGYMKIFASEYPDFPFLQVPLAKLQELANMQARLATQRSRPHVYKKKLIMKKLIFTLLFMIPVMGYCQTSEEKYFLYNIVSFEGDFTKEEFKVFYDDGIEVKRLRNEKGEKARFSTPAGALMYFISQGWEMYLNGATSKGSSFQGTGSSSTNSYWILRKPCTKEEFEKAVEAAKKK